MVFRGGGANMIFRGGEAKMAFRGGGGQKWLSEGWGHIRFFEGVGCSVSRWRPQKVDKRMVLEHTHGLFIT